MADHQTNVTGLSECKHYTPASAGHPPQALGCAGQCPGWIASFAARGQKSSAGHGKGAGGKSAKDSSVGHPYFHSVNIQHHEVREERVVVIQSL